MNNDISKNKVEMVKNIDHIKVRKSTEEDFESLRVALNIYSPNEIVPYEDSEAAEDLAFLQNFKKIS